MHIPTQIDEYTIEQQRQKIKRTPQKPIQPIQP